ncbi:hypothetical protein GCM10020221_06280 [Streptomyces thioluteus]|uniref:TetR family transcriptional regulator n=1 Tax=Streptomyces thioluteus TaxID=66431 RepID=A0ABN3WHT8_STRTU
MPRCTVTSADRRELIHHVTLSVMGRIARQAEAARAEEPDAFRALRRFVHAAAAERVGALCPQLEGYADHDHPDLVAARGRLEAAVQGLMDAAHTSGQLRSDIGLGDLMVAITQLTRPLPGKGCPEFEPLRPAAPAALPGRPDEPAPLGTPGPRRDLRRTGAATGNRPRPVVTPPCHSSST